MPGIRPSPDQTSIPTIDVIKHMDSGGLTVVSEPQSEVPRHALSSVEHRLGEELAWTKWLVMEGIEYARFIARRLVLGFAAANDVLNGIAEKDTVKIAFVIVKAVVPGGRTAKKDPEGIYFITIKRR